MKTQHKQIWKKKKESCLTADFNILQTSLATRASESIRTTFWEKLLRRIKDHSRVLSCDAETEQDPVSFLPCPQPAFCLWENLAKE